MNTPFYFFLLGLMLFLLNVVIAQSLTDEKTDEDTNTERLDVTQIDDKSDTVEISPPDEEVQTRNREETGLISKLKRFIYRLLNIFEKKEKEIIPSLQEQPKSISLENSMGILQKNGWSYFVLEPTQCADNYGFSNEILDLVRPEELKSLDGIANFMPAQREMAEQVLIDGGLDIHLVHMFAYTTNSPLCDACSCLRNYKVFFLLSGNLTENVTAFGLRQLNDDELEVVTPYILILDYYLNKINQSCIQDSDCQSVNVGALCNSKYLCVNKTSIIERNSICAASMKAERIDYTLLYYSGIDFIHFVSEDLGAYGVDCACVENLCQVN